MRIGILGAGELGRSLAEIFCNDKHDVVIVDNSPELLKSVSEKYDVMTICGNGTTSSVLKTVAEHVDILIAATGDDPSNIIACQISSNLGIEKTICRLSTMDYFSEVGNFIPSLLGISHIIIPEDEVTDKIISSLSHHAIVEKMNFGFADVEITGFKIRPASPLVGIRIKDFPDKELLSYLRFSALIRDNKFIIPHGDTILASCDEVYVAGKKDRIQALLEWGSTGFENSGTKRILIGGGTKLGKLLASRLSSLGYEIRLIEKDSALCEKLLDEMKKDIVVIKGSPTDADILEEAGVNGAFAYISVMKDDEDNILSCILAKRMNAAKVINVTNRIQYQEIVSAITSIDCSISPCLVAVNSILRLFTTEKTRI
ncbi:MAG: NAD-binding protein, partial [Candidatus Nanoarchaeia archaeon]